MTSIKMKRLKPIRRDRYRYHTGSSEYTIPQRAIRFDHNGERVSTFTSLLKRLAFISYCNPQYSFFFRGQSKDHWQEPNGTLLYPEIYRLNNDKVPTKADMASRFHILEVAEEILLDHLKCANYWMGFKKLDKFRELRWAVLQHYKICSTPLLDITPSLDAALAFAKGDRSKYGYLYVLALPPLHHALDFNIYEELVAVNLKNICPPLALRPFYQNAYLLGSYPINDTSFSRTYNASRRLIAKYKIQWSKFWDGPIRVISPLKYFPKADQMATACRHVATELQKQLSNQSINT